MKVKKKYVEKLLETTEKDLVTLQLNLPVTKAEKQNLEALVDFLKKNNQKASVRSICYGALQESGVFDEINIEAQTN
jgi:hypothetical protein